MTIIQWLRDKLRLDPHLTKEQLDKEFLRKASKLASKGIVEIYQGTPTIAAQTQLSTGDHMFLVVFRGSKIKWPREFRKWFKEVKH